MTHYAAFRAQLGARFCIKAGPPSQFGTPLGANPRTAERPVIVLRGARPRSVRTPIHAKPIETTLGLVRLERSHPRRSIPAMYQVEESNR